MSLVLTANQLIPMSPVTKKRSFNQLVRTRVLWNYLDWPRIPSDHLNTEHTEPQRGAEV